MRPWLHWVLLVVAPLSFLLAGCSEIPWYQQGFAVAVGLHNQAVKDRQAFHDEQLRATLDLVCDTSAGALGRIGLTDPGSRDYIMRHCGIAPNVGGTPGSAVFMP